MASTTGTIAVLDLKLRNGATLAQLDDPAGPMFVADMKAYASHRTPLLSNGSLDLARIRTTTTSASVATEIRVRGASSRNHPKKGYKLDLSSAVGLLGMPAEKDWVLHSCWADKTCLRNVLGYWQAAKLFPWAPRTEFVEVFINDSYRGLYVLIENVKLGPNRVNLPAPTDNQFNGEITGTYVIKRNGNDRGDWASSIRPTLNWKFATPSSSLTPAQRTWMKDFMNWSLEPRFHRAYVNYDAWNYEEYMDERSAVDFMIIQELSNNVDAYWKSMHLTKQRIIPGDNLVYMGPIWDLDLAFANYNYAPEGLCGNTTWRMNTTKSGVAFQPLWEIWRMGPFRQAIRDRWNALRNAGTISRSRFETKIDEFRVRIENARMRDNTFGNNPPARLGQLIGWNTINSSTWEECQNFPTYAEYLTHLKTWIRCRIDCMDARIAESAFVNP